jgi:hypothetical protein
MEEECTHCHKIEALADIRQTETIAAVASGGWDAVALRTEQLKYKMYGVIWRK